MNLTIGKTTARVKKRITKKKKLEGEKEMLLKVDDNRFINKSDISEVLIENKYVQLKDKSRRTIAYMEFDSEEEAKDYRDKLSFDITDVIGLVAEKVENIGYDLENLLEEMKKISQALYA